MQPNVHLIEKFYNSFARLDAAQMVSCYADDIIFYDPMFEMLEAEAVKKMWMMLCANAKDFNLTYGNIKDLGDGYYTCNWVAKYTFSKTGRKVTNNVLANMKIENGKIIEHSDGFSIHRWASQALGFSGWLLGWNSLFQRKLKNQAKRSLINYMESNN